VRAEVHEVCDGLACTLEELCDLSWACSGHLRRGRPRAGRRRWSGPHRSRSGCSCGPTAGSRPLRSNRVLPSPSGPFTNAKHADDSAVGILIERADPCGPSGSAMIASAASTPSQLGSGRPAGLGGGRRRHHGLRQPGRGRHRTYRAAPRHHGRSFIRTGSGASPPGACRRRNAS